MKKLKNYLPVTRKEMNQMNEYYSQVIDGLLVADKQHGQMELAIISQINKKDAPKKHTNGDNRFYQ